jgi:hypothetical protein
VWWATETTLYLMVAPVKQQIAHACLLAMIRCAGWGSRPGQAELPDAVVEPEEHFVRGSPRFL